MTYCSTAFAVINANLKPVLVDIDFLKPTISVKQINLGVDDRYIRSGSYKYMLNYFNLSPDKIVKNVMNALK